MANKRKDAFWPLRYMGSVRTMRELYGGKLVDAVQQTNNSELVRLDYAELERRLCLTPEAKADDKAN